MKIFHTEKGKEKVYVQLNDLGYLISETHIAIPTSIYLKFVGDGININDSNRYEFIEFEKEDEVKFFKEIDFILDYNQYKDLTKAQIKEESAKKLERINEIVDIWNAMPVEERKRNQKLYEEYSYGEWILLALYEFSEIKEGKKMPFPKFVK